jgi:hypothetical protein
VSPLVVGSSTPVDCKVATGTLASCVIEIRFGGKLVATGEAVAPRGAASLTMTVSPTAAGLSLLRKKPLGVAGTVEAVASATGSPSAMGSFRLLAQPSITLPLAKRSKQLSKRVAGELRQVASLLRGAKSATCTAYSDRGKKVGAVEAKAACAALKKDGFKGKSKAVGAGHKAPNRLVITFRF